MTSLQVFLYAFVFWIAVLDGISSIKRRNAREMRHIKITRRPPTVWKFGPTYDSGAWTGNGPGFVGYDILGRKYIL